MKKIGYITLITAIAACNAQAKDREINSEPTVFVLNISGQDSTDILAFCQSFETNEFASKPIGTVSNGSLENGKLMPYFGVNFTYFDKDSYLASRAFTSDKVLEILTKSYHQLKLDYPFRHFFLMELSNKNGGKIFPHKTHQNGLSVDFMMPKLQNNEPYYGLDTIGKDHYWLDFNDSGEYTNDVSITVDFKLIAHHILVLEKEARKMGYKINKVIIKIEYKDELLALQKVNY